MISSAVTNENSQLHKFGKQCGIYAAKMQEFAQKQTPEFAISTTEQFYNQCEPKINNVLIIVKQIFIFLFELLNVFIQGFFNGYIVMSKELKIFSFPSFIFSKLPLSIQTQISNIQDTKKYKYESFGSEKTKKLKKMQKKRQNIPKDETVAIKQITKKRKRILVKFEEHKDEIHKDCDPDGVDELSQLFDLRLWPQTQNAEKN